MVNDIFYLVNFLPFFGFLLFGILTIYEFRSNLGIFSPSGLTALYALIKFSAETVLVLNYSLLFKYANKYDVYDHTAISNSFLVSFLVPSITYIILFFSTLGVRKNYIRTEITSSFNVMFEKSSFLKFNVISTKYILILVVGLIFFLKMIFSIGGFFVFYSDISHRYQLLAGHGLSLKLSTIFIQLSFLYFFLKSYKYSVVNAYIILIFGIFILFLFGSRTPAIFLLFTSLVSVHFIYLKFKITYKLFSMLITLLIVSVYISLLRFNELPDFSVLSFNETSFALWYGVIGAYFTHIVRDSVIISYFDKNEYWLGLGFSSLIYSFVPRSFYPEKPVIDNGLYVVAMTIGQHVEPPMLPHDLPNYGWPEGYMSGFMEGGWLGLITVIVISSLIIAYVFTKLVKSHFKVEWLFFYSIFMFRQPLYLSNVDIFNILFLSMVIMIIILFIKMKLN